MFRNLIKRGTKTAQDTAKKIAVRVLGKPQSVLVVKPYGLHSNAPSGSFVLLLQPEGQESNMVGIEADTQNQDSLESKEVAIGIPTLTARIKARTDGSFVFVLDDTEGGDYLARFNELKSGFDSLVTAFNNLVTAYNTHTHVSVTSLGTPTPPVPLGSSSSASIDSAKIDKLEVPT